MRRRRQSPFEDLIELASKMPWWASILLALVTYSVLHLYATSSISIPPPASAGDMGQMVSKQIFRPLALFGQYILPAAFLVGSFVSAVNRSRRKNLIESIERSNSSSAINEMSWSEFETLVGEAFRRKGYSVNETGGGGADGGVDLILKKGDETFLVQCKQWRAYSVSVNIVRELYGVMAARGAAGGFVVTSGRFTEEAITFASGRNIELLDGPALQSMIKPVQPTAVSHSSKTTASSTVPKCPVCNGPMVKRTAKQGPNAGSQFWGCPKYPNCRGTLPL